MTDEYNSIGLVNTAMLNDNDESLMDTLGNAMKIGEHWKRVGLSECCAVFTRLLNTLNVCVFLLVETICMLIVCIQAVSAIHVPGTNVYVFYFAFLAFMCCRLNIISIVCGGPWVCSFKFGCLIFPTRQGVNVLVATHVSGEPRNRFHHSEAAQMRNATNM